MTLNRDTILQLKDLTVERVAIPEWGGQEVCIRVFTGKERQRMIDLRDEKGRADYCFHAEFAALSICDEEGNRLFTDAKDIQALGGKNGRALERILEAGLKLNKIGGDEEEERGKSGATQSEDSGTN